MLLKPSPVVSCLRESEEILKMGDIDIAVP